MVVVTVMVIVLVVVVVVVSTVMEVVTGSAFAHELKRSRAVFQDNGYRPVCNND